MYTAVARRSARVERQVKRQVRPQAVTRARQVVRRVRFRTRVWTPNVSRHIKTQRRPHGAWRGDVALRSDGSGWTRPPEQCTHAPITSASSARSHATLDGSEARGRMAALGWALAGRCRSFNESMQRRGCALQPPRMRDRGSRPARAEPRGHCPSPPLVRTRCRRRR